MNNYSYVKKVFIVFILYLSIVLSWAFYPILLRECLNYDSDENGHAKLGQFGDSYGALNTLFSGLAFGGIIVSIFLQLRELKETKSELRGQKDALERQNFEQTFFQLLSTHNQIVNSIDLLHNESGTVTKGRDCFKVFYKRFFSKYEENKNRTIEQESDYLKNLYENFYTTIQQDTGHYFLFLYNMVKYVKHRCKDGEQKFYTNLIRAQLSYDELALLFYNCHCMKNNKFKPLIEEFSFFKNLPPDRLIDSKIINHRHFYSSSAWQN